MKIITSLFLSCSIACAGVNPVLQSAFTTNAAPVYPLIASGAVSINMTYPYQYLSTNANFAFTTFNAGGGSLTPNSQYVCSLLVTNYSGSAITITAPAYFKLIGSSTSASVSLPTLKVAIYSFWIIAGVMTNMVNCVQQ
jgi:hypothetical protein